LFCGYEDRGLNGLFGLLLLKRGEKDGDKGGRKSKVRFFMEGVLIGQKN
jgi:hypothetical protein